MDQQIKQKQVEEFQTEDIKYQMSSKKVENKKYYLFEYKKELNKDQIDKRQDKKEKKEQKEQQIFEKGQRM
ncbi:unnamed protein product [Paramecium sonneborni]|uniref:Uncharacterized protein n=1 Tax=Paramecium sonneborni TaxID=65129 RepID=A0A8S1NU46_9CILI|nr:unnamed protein product [Paramecium sonneborni]